MTKFNSNKHQRGDNLMAEEKLAKEKPLWTQYRVTLEFITKLCASVPADKNLIKTWLEARQPEVSCREAKPSYEVACPELRCFGAKSSRVLSCSDVE